MTDRLTVSPSHASPPSSLLRHPDRSPGCQGLRHKSPPLFPVLSQRQTSEVAVAIAVMLTTPSSRVALIFAV
jgi:hypothetical protein